MNKPLPTLMEMITYKGEELQVVEVELLTEKGSCGADQLLYHCQNRHGEIKQLCDWEIAKDRAKEVSHA